MYQCSPQAKDCTNKRFRDKGRVDEVELGNNRVKSRIQRSILNGIPGIESRRVPCSEFSWPQNARIRFMPDQ
ncbi:MAG: hypothetical protein CXZ00_04005 [Acidobacteria bacterium]|nr:MAG: hypothetical protein CXZ00_04005 [Acidobacteriota bacterium]